MSSHSGAEMDLDGVMLESYAIAHAVSRLCAQATQRAMSNFCALCSGSEERS
jgi:hypothetical protein